MDVRLISAAEAVRMSAAASQRPVLADNASIEDTIVGNATLRKDEWERIDARVNAVLRERLTVADDLRRFGLVEPLSVGSILRTTERLEEFSAAEVNFDGDTAPSKDKPSFLSDTIPVPVISKDFTIGFRQLAASRERGEPLDVTAAESSTRRVRDKIQDLITNGVATGGPTGGGIPGLTTATNRRTVTLNTDWDASGATPVDDVVRMLEAAYLVNLFGPFVLYIPKNYWATIQADYTTDAGAGTSSRTILERLLAFNEIREVRPLDALADDNVVMVQMTRDVLDLSEAQVVTTVQWAKNPMVTNFRVYAIAGPQIKSIETEGGTTVNGIVHLS